LNEETAEAISGILGRKKRSTRHPRKGRSLVVAQNKGVYFLTVLCISESQLAAAVPFL
jgi:hypothetical protein